jgi:hypothetical protein
MSAFGGKQTSGRAAMSGFDPSRTSTSKQEIGRDFGPG